jgi:hypothetical protein
MDEDDLVHHIYDDCPVGGKAFEHGYVVEGDKGWPLCAFCKSKLATGEFFA